MKIKFITSLLTIAFLLVISVSPVLSAMSQSQAILPVLLHTNYGKATGNIESLYEIDQSGTDDDESKYVKFSSGSSSPYMGHAQFVIPDGVSFSSISSAVIQVNVNGRSHLNEIWTWYIYNWTTKKWIPIGNNIGYVANEWNNLYFRVSNLAQYTSSTKQIKVRMVSSVRNASIKVDYMAIHLTYKTVISSGAIVTTVPTKSRYNFAPTFTPTSIPTETATPTP